MLALQLEPFLRGRRRKVGSPRILSSFSGYMHDGEPVGEVMEGREWRPRWDQETRICIDIVSKLTLREFSPLSV